MSGVNNIPATYDHINNYNHLFSPSTIHVKDTGLSWYFKRYLIQKIISVFEFKNIPEHWAKDYFLYTLFVFGYVIVFNTNKYGVIPQHGTLAGYNVFYRPNKAIVANPLLKTRELNIGKNCELIRMQPDWCGAWDIVEYYADLMALTSETAAVNLINSKFSYVFAADNQTSAESLKKLYDQIASGEPAAFADKNLFNDAGDPAWYLFVQNLKQNYIAGDLFEDLAKIDSRFNTEVGIPNVNIAKNSGVSDSEVNANNIDTQSKAGLWLETMRESIDKVNDMFNLEISVDFRYNNYMKGAGDDEQRRQINDFRAL